MTPKPKHYRTQVRRPWIKLYPLDCIDGSIRYQLFADERGVWYDLLNFSALCARPGSLADKDGRPYPDTFIANRLNIEIELYYRTVDKCLDEGRLSRNGSGVLTITNWDVYQSEYQRQKPYREKQRQEQRRVIPQEDLDRAKLQRKINEGLKAFKREHCREPDPNEVQAIKDKANEEVGE